ncbi:MAG: TIGR02996 domain-containing protein [Gemmataceae bacterium]
MSAPLSDEDKAFIRTILNNPAELTGWLAYADWLDERDDIRAEFVRLQLQLLNPDGTKPEVAFPLEEMRVHERLEELRSLLDPNWLAVFERSPIENCDDEFAFKCPKKWERLTGTDNPRVRYCLTCDKKVYHCLTTREAQRRAELGLCVARPSTPQLHVNWRRRNPEVQHVTMGIMRMSEPRPRRPWWKFW